MAPGRARPSEIALQAKKFYHQRVEHLHPEWPVSSVLVADSDSIRVNVGRSPFPRPRVAVFDGYPVDIAFLWQDEEATPDQTAIPILNMAHDRRPGGDWESGTMGPEECLARRSNLVPTLTRPHHEVKYPIPQRGGIYSPNVVVFRDGPDHYQVWERYRSLPVISVSPVHRPKIDEATQKYAFDMERDLMLLKMKTVLRIAAYYHHRRICLGPFGSGPVFGNPVSEIASLWKHLLFEEEEFRGVFNDVVFAIKSDQPGYAADEEFRIFKSQFKADSIFPVSS
ncbi:hypothetical protein BDY21DRAFT_282318 [Lineolata rhizophorae]|uniref:Microbial-type PARG catalytic domain-containing protein n=1 Tax=Lineolata rhizophorae TaxID=578093 RepID=A0A6A6P6U4_9PEZI|nr:hypothetical protein BDY21DRAFT_282318 [Lineolata rhizophorae]